jgi:hypothetical protein
MMRRKTSSSRAGSSSANRRGRPPKYGRPSRVVAVTLPHEIIETLRQLHSDLGWAIVALVEKTRLTGAPPPQLDDAQLVEIGDGQRLIVVRSAVFHALPGVEILPLSSTQAFLALEPGRGMADLELAVIDRLERGNMGERERQALMRFRDQLRRWRRDTHLHFHPRTIITATKRPPD